MITIVIIIAAILFLSALKKLNADSHKLLNKQLNKQPGDVYFYKNNSLIKFSRR